MTNTQKLNTLLEIARRSELKLDLIGKTTMDTFRVVTAVAPVAQAIPEPPPVVAQPQARKQAKPKASKTAKDKPSAKPHEVVTTKSKRDIWYALEGGVRDSVGMSSKTIEGGRVRCVFFAKKGRKASASAIAKAVAVVK
jgi:hypothetical protein